MSLFGNVLEDTEQTGPCVDAETPEERIAARRLRIDARYKAKKRQEQGDDNHEKKEIKVEARRSQQQMELSEKQLIILQREGTVMVTNIKVVAEATVSKHRSELEEARRLRIDNLEKEAISSLEKFEEINRNWTVAKMKEIPQDLRDALNSQQQLCGLLIEDKNKVIHELQQEMKLSDDHYVKDLKKQAESVDLMIEKMEKQVKFLKESYRLQLDQVQNSLEQERKILLTGNMEEWEKDRKARSDKELEYVMQRRKQVEEYEGSLQKLRTKHAEEYNKIKFRLDTYLESRQHERQQVKATNQLKQEQSEYTANVSKKREQENNVTKSQQKRKINRVQDVLNNLKIKGANQEKLFKEENQNLTDDYRRLKQQYEHMQMKMRHFAFVGAKPFEDMWLMNEEELKVLVEKALDVDRLIHEQQLGLAWQRPLLAFMEHCGPLQRQAQKTAHQAATELLQPEETSPSSQEKYKDTGAGPGAESPGATLYESGAELESGNNQPDRTGSWGKPSGMVSVETVKRLLELLCDEAGFLIESRLIKLLSPLDKDKQSLVKLDSIFTALGVQSEEDMFRLADFFMEFRHPEREQTEDVSAEGGVASSHEARDERMSSCSSTSDLIHPNDVLVALKAFTAQYSRHRDASELHQPSAWGLGGRDDSEDAAYWKAMADVIPEAKLNVWDAMETALNKYQVVLTERSKIITETQSLKQQNTELRTLLHLYINTVLDPAA